MYTYTIVKGIFEYIRRSDGLVIPFDEDNMDYAAYLKWVAAGNKAEEETPS